MSGKTKECCTVHSTQSDLQTQFNPYQNPNGTLSRQRNNHPKIRKESKGLWIAKIIFKNNKAGGLALLISNRVV